jgi:UDP-N-acetylmuramoylalanine--D-glutamate ligase
MQKRLVVIGGGESGVGAAVLAKHKGYDVFLSDKAGLKLKYKEVLNNEKIEFEEGSHTEEKILNATEVVKSPGVPDKVEMIKKIKAKGIPVISEIEFAGRYTSARIIGITGTNGKTTTTLLTHHILKKAGLNVRVAGNVGKGFAMSIAENPTDCDYYVLELSSFQLDGLDKFRINTAILTNITPDHLDRYEYQLQNYVNSKFLITKEQTAADHFIYCADDVLTIKNIDHQTIHSKKLAFSIKKTEGMTAYTQNEQLIINLNNTITNMFINDLALKGKHNLYNSMAAGIAARLVDISDEVIKESLMDFEGIEHRLEKVTKVRGVEYINDSKATNVNSTWYALECMSEPVIWIVGGIDKGNNYDELKEVVAQKVKAIICLGVDNSKIVQAFKDIVPIIEETQSMERAVKLGYQMGKKGDVVLLSPACASFDLFENYEERGRAFKMNVREL